MRCSAVWLLLALCLAAPARSAVLELRAARVASVVDGLRGEADARLPYHWDHLHRDRPGHAEFEIRFDRPAETLGALGLYFPRVGNRAEIWLNGILLAQHGRTQEDSSDDYAKTPLFVLLPDWVLLPDNRLRILIEADGGRRGGLWTPMLGPVEEVRDIYQRDHRWRVSGSLVVAVFSLIVGMIALLLWLTQRNARSPASRWGDELYLSAGLAELFWVLRLSDFFLDEPPLPWLGWGILQTVAYTGWTIGTGFFCHHAAGWSQQPSMRWMKRFALAVMLMAGPIAYLALSLNQRQYLTGWFGLLTLAFVAYSIFYIGTAFRRATFEHRLLAFAGAFNIVAGVRDWVVIQVGADFQAVAWIRYSSVLFGLALLYIVITRFRRTSEQARDLMHNMEARVREKEAELAQSYGRLEQLAREQERAAERTRILRDMHDGVGAHISSAIRQLQTGHAGREELLRTLRDSLDQLKLSIDAVNLPAGDVTALLANLRYRLEPRLKASDIELVWAVEQVEPLGWLDDKGMRQLQFMVHEAISNVLQHAGASRLTLGLKAGEGQRVTLRVQDNGHGFNAEAEAGRELHSLRERAAALGARLDITSGPGGTTVEIGLG